jgi:hypothetical protein
MLLIPSIFIDRRCLIVHLEKPKTLNEGRVLRDQMFHVSSMPSPAERPSDVLEGVVSRSYHQLGGDRGHHTKVLNILINRYRESKDKLSREILSKKQSLKTEKALSPIPNPSTDN